MPGYRFCRPDDIPLLAQALADCYDVHFPNQHHTTVERFMFDVRVHDLWSSSCMIGFEGNQVMAVLIGCKRADETLIHSIGVDPDFIGQGHLTHMLTSLSAKLAVLGPPTITTYVPQRLPRVANLFERLGYLKQPQRELRDYYREQQLEPLTEGEMFIEPPIESIAEDSILQTSQPLSWRRTRQMFRNGAAKVKILALAPSDTIEALIAYRDDDLCPDCEILRFAAGNPETKERCCLLLLRRLAAQCGKPIAIPQIEEVELGSSFLEKYGFSCVNKFDVYQTTAEAA